MLAIQKRENPFAYVRGNPLPLNPASNFCFRPTGLLMTRPIPDKLFFKIGEVAEIVEIEQHVLRYWEEEFDVLKPTKNRSGQRLYQRKDVDIVVEIQKLLYEDKYTIAGAKQRLKSGKKATAQLDFAFDREKFLVWRKEMKSELESLIKIIDS